MTERAQFTQLRSGDTTKQCSCSYHFAPLSTLRTRRGELVVRLLIMHRAALDLATRGATPLWIAAQENKPECIAILAAAKASLEGAKPCSPINKAAIEGADESVRLLAYLGARLIEPAAPDWDGGPFWRRFKDNKGRVRDPALWERIVAEGGDEGTPASLEKRIRMLKEAKVHDPRDGTSW